MQFLSKIIWYQKFNFLTWQLNLLRGSKIDSKFNVNSFYECLRTICSFAKLELISSTNLLIIAQVLYQQHCYTYLTTQNKFTILKPKFNLVFPSKSVLLFKHFIVNNIGILETFKVTQLLKQLSLLSLKQNFKVYPNKNYIVNTVYYKLKLLSLNKYFYLVRIFPRFLSTFQNKINFFQFKIFLKKLL